MKERLLEEILTGRYRPDARIVETQVARELGTSQAPVREALRGLEALGVVEITPFRGARVRRATRRELLEAYVVRSALEALGARLAVPRLDARRLDELAGHVEDMEAAALAGDGHTVAEADARFHGRIVELADNGSLAKLWRSLEPFSRTYLTRHRARRRPRVVGRAARADPRRAPGARRRRRRRRAGPALRRGQRQHGRPPDSRNR